MRRGIQRAAIAIATGLLLAAPCRAAAECVRGTAAAPVIAKNSLLPGNKVYDMVQSRTGGKIIHASLCDEGGRFLYKLVVLGPKGDVTNVTVDARTGQP
jgi:uncharacterized membrane protein YkoI